MERQRLREEFAAQRAKERGKEDKKRRILEKLREEGKLKCKACKRKIIDFTVSNDWGAREYHKADRTDGTDRTDRRDRTDLRRHMDTV